MAAGDLENIIPAPNAKLTRNINFSDVNGVLRSVKEVYYSDNNAQFHLVWKRDHAPTQNEYITNNISTSQGTGVYIPYVSKTNTITSLKIWTINNFPGDHNKIIDIRDASWNSINHITFSYSNETETLVVDGNTTTVNVYTVDNLSISVTAGETYYIYIGPCYATHAPPIFYKTENGTYWYFTGDEWRINNNQSIANYVIEHTGTGNLPKLEVNGEQV